jgi:Protein of unknown function (DUF2877)
MTAYRCGTIPGVAEAHQAVLVPGVVSTAIREPVLGPPRAGRLLAVFPAAVYIDLGGTVVAVVTRDGVRLPNAVVVPLQRGARPFAQVNGEVSATVGSGDIVMSGLVVHAVRHWDPRPLLPPVDPVTLSGRLAGLRGILAASPARPGLPVPQQLAGACMTASPAAAAAAADQLVGLGPGLTPSGDDLLAGTLAALRLLGGDPAFTTALADHVSSVGAGRTTALSATLLRLAGQGDVAGEVGQVIKALNGSGSLDEAVGRLCAVGHTSGADLAQGLLIGGTAALGHLVKGATGDRAR